MPNRIFTIIDAIYSLTPSAVWLLRGSDGIGGYQNLEWISEDIPKPSEEELNEECKRLQAEYDELEYQRLRAAEYPDFKDFLDGWVKEDSAQLDKYRADCLAVKEKFPKNTS